MSKLKHGLEDNGCQVFWMEADPKAVAAVAEKYFDLIVLNIEGPEAIGSELLSRLEDQHHELAAIPKVILTPQAQINDVINQFELPPPISYLAKEAHSETRLMQIIQEIYYLTDRYI